MFLKIFKFCSVFLMIMTFSVVFFEYSIHDANAQARRATRERVAVYCTQAAITQLRREMAASLSLRQDIINTNSALYAWLLGNKTGECKGRFMIY